MYEKTNNAGTCTVSDPAGGNYIFVFSSILAVSGGCGIEDVEKIRNDGDRRTTGSQKGRTGLE